MTTEQIIKIDYTKFESKPSSKATNTIEVEAKTMTNKPVKLKMKLYKTSNKKQTSIIKGAEQAKSNIRSLDFIRA